MSHCQPSRPHMGLIYIADELHVERLVIEAEGFEDSMLSKQWLFRLAIPIPGNRMTSSPNPDKQGGSFAFSLAIGIAIGICGGAVMGNIALGVTVGVGIGVMISVLRKGKRIT